MSGDNGGNAFPALDNSEGVGLHLREFGMTLRDAVAKAVLPVLIERTPQVDDQLRAVSLPPTKLSDRAALVARAAFDFAEAFVAEKRKRDSA